jgi:hypothetical protein
MTPDLQTLIERMGDTWTYAPGQKKVKDTFESNKTVAFLAHNEARRLNDITYLPQLFEFIKSDTNPTKRKHACLIAGSIATNTSDTTVCTFFLEVLPGEKNTEVIDAMLRQLALLFKPLRADLTAIYKLTEHKSWRIRASAFEALTNTEHPVEQYLADRLRQSTNKDDIHFLLHAISYVATEKSLEAIEPHIKNKKPETKDAAKVAIALLLLRAGYDEDYIVKKAKYPLEGVRILRDRVHSLTRSG